MIEKTGFGVAATLILLAVFAADGMAQQLNTSRFRRNPGEDQRLAVKATRHDPALLKTQLLAIHGFNRNGLEGSSTEVENLLRWFITDPAESPTVKRQAIKALGLFPSEQNLTFIEGRLASAAPGQKVLYLLSLREYIPGFSDRVSSLVINDLSSNSVTVRHAALSVAGGLTTRTEVRTALEQRLSGESDPSVRSSITRLLGR